MIRLFFKQQKSNITEKGQNKIESKILNKAAWRRKLAFVVVMILVLSFGGSVQAYAASDAYAYEILDRVSAGKDYPSIQGLALGDGQAYVLKTTGASGTECVLYGGKKTNLIEIKDKRYVGHGNDMTYNKWNDRLYVAPSKDKKDKMYIYRMTTKGEVDAKIKTDYMVGGIACWLNYDKDNERAAFVLKDTDDLFHIVQINGTKLKELAKFKVNIAEKEKLNQGICMYDGYLYVTYANSQNGNSYVYRVDKKIRTILKEYEEGKTKYYAKTRVVTLDKKKLLASLPEKPDDFKSPVKLELESIAFSDGYLYFTANANYENKAGKSRSLDGLYKVTKQLA